jgi:predicted O-methyltransferase YrrM
MIRIAFEPFLGQYPSFSHALNPATNVASGQAIATSSWLLSDSRANPARERTATHRCQPSLVNSCSAASLSRSRSCARRCSRSSSLSLCFAAIVASRRPGPPDAGHRRPRPHAEGVPPSGAARAGGSDVIRRSAEGSGAGSRSRRGAQSGQARRAATAPTRHPSDHGRVADDRQELRATFDSAADLYHQARPDYPEPLYDTLVQAAGLRVGDQLLEIGCATGKATIPLARRFRITCIEIGSALTAAARSNLADFRHVEIIESAFETWSPQPARQFDLVFAATAWHWLDPATRYQRAWQLLRSGGHLAFCRAWVLAVIATPPRSEEL